MVVIAKELVEDHVMRTLFVCVWLFETLLLTSHGRLMVNACPQNAVLRAERPDGGGVCQGESEKIPRVENGECMRVCSDGEWWGGSYFMRYK